MNYDNSLGFSRMLIALKELNESGSEWVGWRMSKEHLSSINIFLRFSPITKIK